MSRFILFLVLSTVNISLLHAGGGWPQPKGDGYFKLYQWWVIANQHYTDVGLIDPNTTNSIFNTSLYGEYGFSDRFTGVLNFPFFSRAYFNNTISGTTGELLVPGEAINSIGDTDLGLKFGLTKNKPLALSATLTLGLPLGNNEGGTQGNLQTGDGEFNQMLQVDAGRGFQLGKTPAYANAYLGFNNRSNGYSDELRWGIEAGANLFDKKLWAIARIIAIESLQNGNRSVGENSTSIFANNTEFISFTPELAWSFNEKWGVAASVGTAFSGRIIFANPSYSVGVFFNLK